ncbi:MAG: SDR family oxidoreductase [bacterium]
MPGTALVTGTSSGIGLETAVALAKAGFLVVATMRDQSRRRTLDSRAAEDGVTLEVRELDVQQSSSVRRGVADVLERHGRIDVLVNNAGAGYLGAMEQTSEATAQRIMDVNYFGTWRMTHAVLPSMRRAGSGHIISVTSIGGLVGQPFNDAYCASKFAVEGLMESLAPVAQRLGISVSLIEPGAVHSEFVASVMHTSEHLTPELQGAYGAMLNAYTTAAEATYAAAGQTSADVAACIVGVATGQTPGFRHQTSALVRGIVARKYVDPTGDSVVAMSGARLP